MRVQEIQDGFGIENLKLAQRPAPQPGPGEVLVEVRANSLNFRDLMTVLGRYNPNQRLPLIPLSDGAGEVRAVGDGVTRVKPGDRVAGIFAQQWLGGTPGLEVRTSTLGGPLDGMLAEQVVLHEDGLVKVPEHLSDGQAATLPCAAVTAWHALMENDRLMPGQTVLVQGTGGVSMFALQFAKAAGARVIITSSSDDKLARARELGADETINYRNTPDWEKPVLDLTDGLGVDHVVEVGGAGTFGKSLESVRIAGTVTVIGVLSGFATEANLRPILMKAIRVQGAFVGSRQMFERMNRAIGQHRIVPIVDQVFAFDEAGKALELMQRGAHFGKIVIGR
ncbi:MAG: NAD(P)-dependent alcohol dehydrogenase [Pseudomonadota bacterium]|nr:NAD(P)-dependent alcohol dehydrogenase [Pseudomonadota bacterium]